MPATLRELVDASANAYNPVGEMLFSVAGINVHVTESTDGTTILAFRGSLNAQDWIRDFVCVPCWDNELGLVDTGFIGGLDTMLEQLAPVFNYTKPIAITGHSLGGAHARLAAAKLVYRSQTNIQQLVTFASPKAGYANHARIIQKSSIEHLSFRNRNDIVPELPVYIPMVDAYVHTEQYTLLDVAPDVHNFEPLRDHSIALYQQGIK